MGPLVPQLETAVARLARGKARHRLRQRHRRAAPATQGAGLRSGDEVITTPFHVFRHRWTIHNAGGTPVFVDIDPGTFNIDPAAVEAAITPRTRAILPVHLYGQMAALERLLPIARVRGSRSWKTPPKPSGRAARSTGSGGWPESWGWRRVFLLSEQEPRRVGRRRHDGHVGRRPRRAPAQAAAHGGAKQYHHDEVGTNSRLDSIQSAVLLAKLPYSPRGPSGRREHAATYTNALADVSEVRTPVVEACNEPIFHQYTLRVERRDDLQAHLKSKGVGNAVYYPVAAPPPELLQSPRLQAWPASRGRAGGGGSDLAPIYPELTRDQVDYVADTIRGFYR